MKETVKKMGKKRKVGVLHANPPHSLPGSCTLSIGCSPAGAKICSHYASMLSYTTLRCTREPCLMFVPILEVLW